MQEEKFAWEREQKEKDREAGVGVNGTTRESENKGASFLLRALGSNEAYEKTGVGPRSWAGQTLSETAPNLLNALPGAIGNSPERQVSDSAQNEFIMATLRQDSGAAIPKEELERHRLTYFPMPGEGPEAVEQKRRARLRAIEGLKMSAGRLETEAEERYNKLLRASPIEEKLKKNPFEGLPGKRGAGAAEPWFPTDGDGGGGLIIPSPEYTEDDIWKDGAPFLPAIKDDRFPPFNEDGAPLVGVNADDPRGATPEYGVIGQPGSSISQKEAKERYRQKLQSQLDEMGYDPSAPISYAERALTGLEMGLTDEIEGLGGAVGALFSNEGVGSGYRLARDRTRLAQEQAREAQGVIGHLVEIGGGILAPAKTGAFNTARGAAKTGAAYGAAAGFGYGEGALNSIAGAALGGAAGGILGAGTQKGLSAIADRRAISAASKMIDNAPEVARAGEAEGVNVIRAMVDPRLQNRVTGVDASMVGGPRFQRGIGEIEGQIEGRVAALGGDGTPMNATVAGQAHKAAGERFISESGTRARRVYDRAENLAGDAKVEPATSLRAVDDAIARLGETPGTNQAEIAFLQTLKGDLSKDLSVGGLRRLRTTLRKKISKGDLVFGEDEARVLEVMNRAADDIRTGLERQGRGEAAKAFDLADQAYRERMDYITGTLQKVVGKRGQNKPAEAIANDLAGMVRGKDTEGVRKFLATLTPEEHADVAATFAEAIGKNNKGEFSVAHLLSQTTEKKFPAASLKTIFGDEGAASIQRLRVLGKEVNRVTGAMNSRKSGTGVANDYRSWLFNLMLGAGAGTGTGSITTGLAAAAVPAAAKAARDALSARSLLSTQISKWVASAPRTTNPGAINAHIARLASISGGKTAASMDAKALQEWLRASLTNSPGRAAAQDETDSRREPPQ
jgi:hypothetical protein